MRPEFVAEVSDPVHWSPGIGWLLVDRAGHRLATLDADLRPTWEAVLPDIATVLPPSRDSDPENGHFQVSLAPDRTGVAVVSHDGFVVLDPDGGVRWRRERWFEQDGLPSEPGCHLDGHGRLWLYVPAGPDDPRDQLEVYDARDGSLIVQSGLRHCRVGAAVFHPHPDREHVGIHVMMGQDGSTLTWVRLNGDELVPREFPGDCLAGLNSTGEWYLATPHDHGDFTIRDFATGAVRLIRHQDEITGPVVDDDYEVSYGLAMISDEHLLIGIIDVNEDEDHERHVLVSLADLTIVDSVEYDESMPQESIRPAGLTGRWLTSGDDGSAKLWRLPTP